SNPSLNKFQIGLLTAIPGACSVVCMLLVGMSSDRTGERRWHVAVPAFIGAVGWWLSATSESPVGVLIGLCLAHAGTMCTIPVFWSLPTAFLSGTAAAAGIAWINSVGNLGGFAGSQVLGNLAESPLNPALGLVAGGPAASALAKPDFTLGLKVMAFVI